MWLQHIINNYEGGGGERGDEGSLHITNDEVRVIQRFIQKFYKQRYRSPSHRVRYEGRLFGSTLGVQGKSVPKFTPYTEGNPGNRAPMHSTQCRPLFAPGAWP